jgi:prepilin-type processing-associated H-X9-DG protein
MSIPITCNCGRNFETPGSIAGTRVRCPDCGQEQTVPQPVARSEELFELCEAARPRTSGNAIYSLFLGCLFFFVCFTGIPAIHFGFQAIRDIKRSKGQLRGRQMAIAGIVLGVIDCLLLVAIFLPAHRSAREAARRAQCTNNLKQIGLAMQVYHHVNGCLPAAAITGKDGKPLLSWRVAILPYIGTGSPYWKFHLDEPWDSPHNLALVEEMPAEFNCPSDTTQKWGMTGYIAVIGARTVFRPDYQPVRYVDITDGVERTILVAESRRAVPWTKPDDIPFAMALAPDGLGSHHGDHDNGYNVLFADGSARFLDRSNTKETISSLLIRDGSEDVSPNSY